MSADEENHELRKDEFARQLTAGELSVGTANMR